MQKSGLIYKTKGGNPLRNDNAEGEPLCSLCRGGKMSEPICYQDYELGEFFYFTYKEEVAITAIDIGYHVKNRYGIAITYTGGVLLFSVPTSPDGALDLENLLKLNKVLHELRTGANVYSVLDLVGKFADISIEVEGDEDWEKRRVFGLKTKKEQDFFFE